MTHPSKAKFADRMRTERIRAGLSQNELARRLSESTGYVVDGSSVTRMENGDRGVRLVEAVAIAEVLGLPLAGLLTDESALEARLDEIRFALADAEAALGSAVEEVSRRQEIVDGLREESDALQGQVDDEEREEMNREAEEWRRENLGL